jgi:dUTP pyrophosphatase
VIAYLAHPIDLDNPAPGLLNEVHRDLRNTGFVVFDPAEAFSMPTEATPDGRVEEVNQTALRLADVVVVLQPELRTIGTVLEMAAAVQSGKPTVILSEAIGQSWSLAGFEKYENAYLTDHWSLDHAEWLRNMLSLGVKSDPAIVPLKYAFLTPEANQNLFAPGRQYPGDAGFDLFVSRDTEIPVGQFKDVPCDIALEFPPGVWGLIIGRSSTLRKHNLMVTPGVIDNGYRGPLYAGVYNMNGVQFSAKRGMRLAQIIPFPLTASGLLPVEVPHLGGSDRGQSGFGSTGE